MPKRPAPFGKDLEEHIVNSKRQGTPSAHGGPNTEGDGHRKRKRRPCGYPPSAPTGVVFRADATEAKTHLEFSGRVKWNEVTTNEGGGPVKVESYQVQLRVTDAGGTPVDLDAVDNKPKLWFNRKAGPKTRRITAATAAASIATFTTGKPHGFITGDKVKVKDVTPSAYNGEWTVITGGGSTFTANIGSTPGNGSEFGTVDDADDWMHVFIPKLSRPRKWYYQARVRCVDKQNCAGDWSAWTSPILPWTGADPKPSTVTGVILQWDVLERSKWDRVRALITWNEVVNFDYPGTVADDEPDMAGYEVQLQSSNDGVSGHWPPRSKFKKAKQDPDAGAGGSDAQAMFKAGIKKKYFYRARVRAVDRFNRRGDWSTWTAWASPTDNTAPPDPFNVQAWVDQSRIQVKWDAQNETADADVPNEDTAFFIVEVSKNTAFSPLLFKERRVAETFGRKIQKPSGNHYVRVRAVDSSNNKSNWAYNGGGVSPGTPAVPQAPNAPTVSISFDAGGPKRSRFRALVTVTPGATFADEEDLQYRVQFVHKATNVAPVGTDRRRRVTTETDDDNVVTFPNIRKSHFTFARARTIDRQGRHSAWSAWTSGGLPSASASVSAPTGLAVNVGPRRVQAEWNAAADNDDDVAAYRVRVLQGVTVKKDRRTHGNHYRYMIPAADRGLAHTVEVYALDDMGNQSAAAGGAAGADEKLDETDLIDAFSQSSSKVYTFNGIIRLGGASVGSFQTGTPGAEAIVSMSRVEGKDSIRFKPASGTQTILEVHAEGIRWGAAGSTGINSLLATDATLQLNKAFTWDGTSGTRPNAGAAAMKVFGSNRGTGTGMGLWVRFSSTGVSKQLAHDG